MSSAAMVKRRLSAGKETDGEMLLGPLHAVGYAWKPHCCCWLVLLTSQNASSAIVTRRWPLLGSKGGSRAATSGGAAQAQAVGTQLGGHKTCALFAYGNGQGRWRGGRCKLRSFQKPNRILQGQVNAR